MSGLIFDLNVTSQSIDVMVVDDDGLPVTGLLVATFPTVKYSKAGANADVTMTPTVDLALITTAWTSGGLKERGEGRYRVDLPNAMFTSSAQVTIRAESSGKRIIAPAINVGIQLTGTTLGALSTTERDAIAAALLDLANGIETGVTLRQSQRAIAAIVAGLVTGAGTGTEVFKGIGQASGGTTRATVVVDGNGNRSAVSLP